MADNYIEKRMSELSENHRSSKRINPTLDTLLKKNRSCRGYDKNIPVSVDVLKKIVGVNTLIGSGRNRQALRFRLVTKESVLADGESASKFILEHVKMGGFLPELHLPLSGTEPEAYIVVCSSVPEDRLIDIDLGISLQSMSLKAVEIGFNALVICAIDKKSIMEGLGLPSEPLAVLAVGKGAEKFALKTVREGESLKYYREDGVHIVPKLALEEIIIPE